METQDAQDAACTVAVCTVPEAAEAVARLKGLFPGTTREQEDFWFEQFRRYPLAAVTRSIDRFAEIHGDFVDRPGLLAEIKDQAGELKKLRNERLQKAAAEAEKRRLARDAQRREADESFEAIDALLAPLTDEQLEALKSRVIQQQDVFNPFVAKTLGRADAKSSPLLRSLMAELARKDETQTEHHEE